MDCAVNAPCHVKNVVEGLNSTDKPYLNREMEIMGELASNDTTNIGILSST